jgi:hypothetical protein
MPKIRLFLLSFIGATGVLAFNLCVPSLLNFYFWSQSLPRWKVYMSYIVNLHQSSGTFKRRVVTNFFISTASHIFSIETWWSFLSVQLCLLTASAFVLATLAAKLKNYRAAESALGIFFLSFTVLFSFVTPNDCYDEYAQYYFLFLALLAMVNRQSLIFGLSLMLALLARETTAILLPGILLLDLQYSEKRLSRFLKFFLPLAGALFFFSHFASMDDPRRFQHFWQDNFVDGKRSAETILSFFLAIGLPGILLLSRPRSSNREFRAWKQAFWITLPLNTLMVFFLAQARESRLLALPLIFLWPICGEWMATLREQFKAGFAWHKFLVGACVLSSLAVLEYYHPSYRHILGYQIYAGLIPLFALLAFSVKGRSSPE